MASETPPPLNIHALPTTYLPTQPPTPEPYAPHRAARTPIVIDNGSTTLRWGFGTSDAPTGGPNAVAKYKERKTNKPLLLFGEAIDAESGARGQARTPWEGDVLLNFDALVSPPRRWLGPADGVLEVGECPGLRLYQPGHRHADGGPPGAHDGAPLQPAALPGL